MNITSATPLRPWQTYLGILALGISVLMISIDQFIVNVSISTISGELGVSDNNGTWSITAYSVASAMVIPLTGWFSIRFGWIRVLITSVLLFTLFSVLCGLSDNLATLVIMRLLQGAAGGPLLPLGQGLMLYLLSDRKSFAMGLYGLIITVGPAIGPVIGGWLTFDYSWRWIFYVNVPIGIMAAILLTLTLRPIENKIEREPLDVWGLILFCISIGSLQVMLDKGFDYDWFRSKIICILLIISIISGVFFIIWEWFEPKPMIRLQQLQSRNFSLGSFLISLAMLLVYSNLIVGPIWVQSQLGYTQEWAGFTLAPLGITSLICFPLIGLYLQRMDMRIWTALGFLVLFASFLLQSNLVIQTPFSYIGWSRAIMGIGYAMFYVPLATITLSDVHAENLAQASGFFSSLRTIAMSIGVSIGTNYWLRTSNFFQSRYMEFIIPSNPAYTPYVTTLTDQLHLTPIQSQDFLYKMVVNQAQTECFFQLCYISGIILLVSLAFIPFLKPKSSRQATISPE